MFLMTKESSQSRRFGSRKSFPLRATLLTDGPIAKKIIAFAIPLFIGNLFPAALQYGRFSDCRKFSWQRCSGSRQLLRQSDPSFGRLFNGIAVGAGVVIARYYGARDKENLSRAIHTDLAFGLAAGILLTIIGLVLAPKILIWMGTPADVLKNSVIYFRIYFCGSIAFVMYNIFVGIMQSVGDRPSSADLPDYFFYYKCCPGPFICRCISLGRWERGTCHDHLPVCQRFSLSDTAYAHPGGLSGISAKNPFSTGVI